MLCCSLIPVLGWLCAVAIALQLRSSSTRIWMTFQNEALWARECLCMWSSRLIPPPSHCCWLSAMKVRQQVLHIQQNIFCYCKPYTTINVVIIFIFNNTNSNMIYECRILWLLLDILTSFLFLFQPLMGNTVMNLTCPMGISAAVTSPSHWVL